MEGSDGVVLSSSIASPKVSIPLDGGESDVNSQGTGVHSLNSKRQSAKNLMSSTISSSCKANLPRKKVLTERNEASEAVNSRSRKKKSPNLCSAENGSDGTPFLLSRPPVAPLSSLTCGLDNQENSVVEVEDLRAPPYDPLTNYLSPRPKFLRYNPNRRRETFLRYENQAGQENYESGKDELSYSEAAKDNGEEDVLVSLTSFVKGSSVKLAGEGNQEGEVEIDGGEGETEDEDENEDWENDENRCWTLKEVLKVLLLSMVLVLSTLFISSMNTPRLPHHLQSNRLCCLNHTIEDSLLVKPEGGSIWDQKEETQDLFVFVHRSFVEKQGFEKDTDLESALENSVEKENTDCESCLGSEETGHLTEEAELPAGEGKATEKIGGKKTMEETVTNMGEDFELKDGVGNSYNRGKGNAEGAFDDTVENSSFEAIEPPEECESLQDLTVSLMAKGFDQDEHVSEVSTVSRSEFQSPVEIVGTGGRDMAGSKVQDAQQIFNEVGENDIDIEDFNEVLHHEDENWKEKLTKFMEFKSSLTVVVGLSITAAFFSAVILGSPIRKKKAGRTIKSCSESPNILKKKQETETLRIENPSLATKPSSSTHLIVEKHSSVFPPGSEEHLEHVDSFRKSMASVYSAEEVESSQEFFPGQAPIVELLNEFVVGEVSSSSKGIRNQNADTKERNYSVCPLQRSVSNTNSSPVNIMPDFSEFSSKGSYGIFTTEKKIVKKEVGREGKEAKVITTPVRRSTRIRNRGVVSP